MSGGNDENDCQKEASTTADKWLTSDKLRVNWGFDILRPLFKLLNFQPIYDCIPGRKFILTLLSFKMKLSDQYATGNCDCKILSRYIFSHFHTELVSLGLEPRTGRNISGKKRRKYSPLTKVYQIQTGFGIGKTIST